MSAVGCACRMCVFCGLRLPDVCTGGRLPSAEGGWKAVCRARTNLCYSGIEPL